MNIIYKLVIGLTITVSINNNVYGQLEKIMTYNIRYDNPNDSINKWDNRKQDVAHLITYYKPEVLGIQEGLVHQLNDLDDKLPEYSRIGVGRDDGSEKGEFTAIYFNHNELSLIKESTFWLSQTPDAISVGWDASMERICTYGLFENKSTKEKILVFNTHYDHIGEIARVKSSELILKKIEEINKDDYPVILMGDFNAEPDSKPVKILTEAFKDVAETVSNGIYGPTGTFTGFEENTIATRRIDYIFVKNLDVFTCRHIDDKRMDNNYISDHLPVLIEVEQR
jgi:endonuclease/exonuclease/phosphatase family metal-dependent hydrolase